MLAGSAANPSAAPEVLGSSSGHGAAPVSFLLLPTAQGDDVTVPAHVTGHPNPFGSCELGASACCCWSVMISSMFHAASAARGIESKSVSFFIPLIEG